MSRMTMKDALDYEHELKIDAEIEKIESRQAECQEKKKRAIQDKAERARYKNELNEHRLYFVR